MRLTDKMHDAVKDSEVGKFLNRLIEEDIARGGEPYSLGAGNIIQQLWAAFMSGREPNNG